MQILRRLLLLALNLGLFALLFGTLVHDAHAGRDSFIYGRGSADGPARAELQALLERFAAGYIARNASKSDAFVDELFAKEDPLVLGTMPREIFMGVPRVKQLVRTDWESWGDCRFSMDRAHVSARGDVAWIAAHGQVTFDLSRFLVVPLRLTAVAVRQPEGWRFQEMQFQFDLDLTRVLIAKLLLIAWFTVNLTMLALELWNRFRGPKPTRVPRRK